MSYADGYCLWLLVENGKKLALSVVPLYFADAPAVQLSLLLLTLLLFLMLHAACRPYVDKVISRVSLAGHLAVFLVLLCAMNITAGAPLPGSLVVCALLLPFGVLLLHCLAVDQVARADPSHIGRDHGMAADTAAVTIASAIETESRARQRMQTKLRKAMRLEALQKGFRVSNCMPQAARLPQPPCALSESSVIQTASRRSKLVVARQRRGSHLSGEDSVWVPTARVASISTAHANVHGAVAIPQRRRGSVEAPPRCRGSTEAPLTRRGSLEAPPSRRCAAQKNVFFSDVEQPSRPTHASQFATAARNPVTDVLSGTLSRPSVTETFESGQGRQLQHADLQVNHSRIVSDSLHMEA